MKIFSWNVNGIRAVQKKGFLGFVKKFKPDILCLQEIKAEKEQLDDELINMPNYFSYFNSSKTKKGYSGVAIYSKIKPTKVSTSLKSDKEFDVEGRLLSLEYKDFVLLNFYFPNGQMNEERLAYKLRFHEAVYDLTATLKRKKKNIIVCGDYNIAHNEIDLKHPKPNENTSGFLRIERDWLDKFEKSGFVDTFRYLHPKKVKYSWWTYMRNARSNNVGWRIDYFWVSDINKIKKALIHNDVLGSDHCPVSIEL
ncbi:MAG: exodeoxyribonuclease III [Thermodesulfobacteriota bacterium]|nr:exodeoxyribonuclease III [Thermodesulfobacteriota bacterium]|tara:strand:+ start:4805 stop:5563 length:759 start_codon:yes stop_codon:yes gene_type:complete